jgi:hypothetical protein
MVKMSAKTGSSKRDVHMIHKARLLYAADEVVQPVPVLSKDDPHLSEEQQQQDEQGRRGRDEADRYNEAEERRLELERQRQQQARTTEARDAAESKRRDAAPPRTTANSASATVDPAVFASLERRLDGTNGALDQLTQEVAAMREAAAEFAALATELSASVDSSKGGRGGGAAGNGWATVEALVPQLKTAANNMADSVNRKFGRRSLERELSTVVDRIDKMERTVTTTQARFTETLEGAAAHEFDHTAHTAWWSSPSTLVLILQMIILIWYGVRKNTRRVQGILG